MSTYYTKLGQAYIRGYLLSNGENVPADISISDYKQKIGKLYNFKKTDLSLLPRVKWIMGIIRSLYIESIIDFGSQRGAMLWPLMNEFENITFTAIDMDPDIYNYLNCVKKGGVNNLSPIKGDITDLKDLPDQSADLVIASEIFEHLKDPQKAADEAIRLSRYYVIVTVPRKDDDNPEHIQLFTESTLLGLFQDHKSRRVVNVKISVLSNNILAYVSLK